MDDVEADDGGLALVAWGEKCEFELEGGMVLGGARATALRWRAPARCLCHSV